ncbi:MAG: sigma-E factor negative regulatory protein [Rhodocyclaceae bacterium]|nr:sigma-E factor negative regulatory protein [Rhodocyclaceae bacterium]
MKQHVSALVDGEQSVGDLECVCSALKRPDILSDFADYTRIGAALRGESRLSFDVSAKVMAALQREPTVFAPQPLSAITGEHTCSTGRFFLREFSALAAASAGVVLVAWVVLSQTPAEPEKQLASTVIATPAVVPAAEAQNTLPQDRFQEYVLAHQTHSSNTALMGGSRNVRAVSSTQNGR